MDLHAEQLDKRPEFAPKMLSKRSLIIFIAAAVIFGQEENRAQKQSKKKKKRCGSGQIYHLFIMDVADLHGIKDINILCITLQYHNTSPMKLKRISEDTQRLLWSHLNKYTDN